MSKSLTVQILTCLVVAYQGTMTGFVMGWPSNTAGVFSSNSTVLSKPMTTFEISLFGSLVNAGALVVSPLCGTIYNNLGRKYATIFFGLGFVIAWAMISVTTNVMMVLVAMALSGVGAAGQAASPIYITEIAEDKIRGTMSACPGTGYFLGILLSYVFGGYFSYHTVVHIFMSMSILSIVLLMLMKESPTYLMLVGKEEEAAKALAFYRWTDVSSKEVQTGITNIKRQLDPHVENILLEDKESQATLMPDNTEDNRNNPTEKNTQESFISQLKYLKKSRSSRRALMVTSSLVCMSVLMGSLAVMVYAEPLFKQAVPTMHPNTCAILLAIVFLISSLLCVSLVDKCGRKMLLITSSLASGVCTLLLGTQLQMGWAPHWFSAVLIYVYNFGYTLGAAVVPFIILSEVFLPEVRGLCNSVVLVIQWSMGFIGLMLFNEFLVIVGPGPIFYFFSAVGFFCAFFTYQWVPEIKGLSLDQIQLAFLKGIK
ncbi:facilitated trehalose transporter Tret1-like [Choristoneura fumiferana]|uniref:facilitated trehalose transporter Tret1-like n=1 Tax=Choristoneura fumiferana TaxID=7141 RepID=UPI003D154361